MTAAGGSMMTSWVELEAVLANVVVLDDELSDEFEQVDNVGDDKLDDVDILVSVSSLSLLKCS